MSLPIGVLGGGLGGLSAALTLAGRGYRVVVFEQSAWLGGKAAVLEEAGYRFDMGPTILTLPSVLARVVGEVGRSLADELDLIRLDPQWRCFFHDGHTLDLLADAAAMAQNLDAFAPGRQLGTGYRSFMAFAQRMQAVSDRFYFWRSIGALTDMMRWGSLLQPGVLADVLAMRLGHSVAGTVRRHVPDERVAQMLDHFTQYVGSAPAAAPAVLCGIAAMQTGEGVWYPRGGTGAVPRLLARLLAEAGVEVRTNAAIGEIVRGAAGQVTGVRTTAGEFRPLAALVCNGDSVRSHAELLGGEPARRFARRRRYEPACSGVVLYLGLDRRYDHLLHHNFVFSADAEAEFASIYARGEPAADPTCYVCAPARSDPAVAPPGGEALYVLVHAPYLRPHHDWTALLAPSREVILDKLARTAGLADLRQRIRVERWLTPQDIQDRYRVWNGAIYGLASHGRFTGAFKPANRSPDVPGLYLAGGSAHPGPGMPMVLMSGWIAADALDQDAARGGWSAARTEAVAAQ